MAVIVDCDDRDAISIEAFVEVARQVDLSDEAAILALAPALRKLGNNKNILREFIKDGLSDLKNFQQNNPYSSQSYILSQVTERAFLRFAIWVPLEFSEKLDEGRFYSYGIAHNHDFSLLTVGMLGSGYTTSIYQVKNGNDVVGYVGEDISLSEELRVQLSPGRVLLYEAGKDIHVQYPAPDFSISLNLIVDQSDKHPLQLYYDVEKKKIAGYVGTPILKRAALFRFAAVLNDETCNNTLLEISNSHPCETTRLYAYRAIATSKGPDLVREQMSRDQSPVVRASIDQINHGFTNTYIWG